MVADLKELRHSRTSLAGQRGNGERLAEEWAPSSSSSVAAVEATAKQWRCAECPVRTECLRYALADPDLVGVWGGTTGAMRRDMRASQGAA
jgi:Transcription factor WhiB